MKNPTLWGSAAALALTSAACGIEKNQTSDIPQPIDPEAKSVAPGNNVKHYTGEKPNILYIVLDDVGFSSFGCYGSEIQTPNIDRLAANGLRYNRFNVTPTSSPTRASLLTGRNSAAVGVGAVSAFDLGPEVPAYRGEITDAAATTAEVLKDEGYNTFMIGKWHLTPHNSDGPMGPFKSWPLGKGFERFYGWLPGETNQFDPNLVVDNHHLEISSAERKSDYHLSADLVDQTIQLIRDQQSLAPERPFFADLSFGATHAPHQPPKEYMEKYKGAYDVGWDRIRRQRFDKQKDLGIIPADADYIDRNPKVEAWEDLSADQKRVYARFQEAYAGFLEHTDVQIGRLIDYLESIGELDTTVIMLLSDNGGSQEGGVNGCVDFLANANFVKTDLQEDILPKYDEIGTIHTSSNYPLGWAQVANTPFPFYKQNTYLGGIRTPLIVHWPEGIKDRGAIRTQFHHVEDVSITIYDILGINTPEVYKGVEQLPVDGVSMCYSFDDADAPTRRPTQFFGMSVNRGMLHEGWMASVRHKRKEKFEDDDWNLFNLEEDFSQAHNLAEEYPEKLSELKQLWMTKAKYYDYLPVVEQTFELHSLVSPEDRYKNRTVYKYYRGTSHLANGVVAPIAGKKHSITVPIERSTRDEEGILLAHGNEDAGYVLYIMNNKLIYEYNFVGTIFRLESNIDVPLGRSTVRFEYRPKMLVLSRADLYPGTARLFIDGKQVAKEAIKTVPFKVSHEGLTIGSDMFGKVSSSYEERGDFPFTGQFEQITIEIEDVQKKLKNFIPKLMEEKSRQMSLSEL